MTLPSLAGFSRVGWSGLIVVVSGRAALNSVDCCSDRLGRGLGILLRVNHLPEIM
jgi:hypothetical protein